MKVRFAKVSFPPALAAAVVFGGVAYAWNSDGQGNIRCGDGSNATAVQQADGTWTVTRAGTHGQAGGSFVTEGKAALYACGE